VGQDDILPYYFSGGLVSHIRPIAICLFRRDDRILVFEGHDTIKSETFYRPLGGGIEFGELSVDTVRRELMEEIGAEVKDLVYLGTVENIFTLDGEPGHEIVQVYDGVLVDPRLYDRAVMPGYEDNTNESIKVLWKSLDEFGPGGDILYPDGLLEMLS
jgi:8-oxo-dGTP pyrophosphatase MutT (NUDIX family)